jgi:hypothetical protein
MAIWRENCACRFEAKKAAKKSHLKYFIKREKTTAEKKVLLRNRLRENSPRKLRSRQYKKL